MQQQKNKIAKEIDECYEKKHCFSNNEYSLLIFRPKVVAYSYAVSACDLERIVRIAVTKVTLD